MARARNCVIGAATAVAAFLVLQSCSDSPTGLEGTGPPAQVDIVSGNGQQGTVGAELPTAVVVRVLNAKGKPVSGQSVNFVVTAGGGRVFAGSGITNAQGLVQERWTLGTVAGEAQKLEARAVDNTTGQAIVFAAFTATAVADVASALRITTQPGTPARSRLALATQPVVRLVDRYGNLVRKSAVAIAASVTPGDGNRTLQGATSVATDASGIATFTNLAILGQAGTLTLTFASAGLTSATSTNVVLAAGDPAAITKLAEDGQTASVASAVASPPSVKVTDADGNAVSGATVTFAVGSGGGQLAGSSVVTNAEGIATVTSWTLGTSAGVNTVTASIGGLSTTFTATATPGVAELTFVEQPSATARSGEPLAQQPRLRLQDQYGNQIHQSGITVTAERALGSANVTVSGGSVSTDADGVASFSSLTLTGESGLVRLRFTVSSTGRSVTSREIALGAAVPASITKVAGDNQVAAAGSAVEVRPAVRVLDTRGIPIPGVRVQFAPAAGGGSVTGADVVTDADGRATVGSWKLGPKVGTNTLTATSEGASVTFTATGFTPVQVQIVSPALLATVGDVLNVAARVTSNFVIARVEAEVEGRQASLVFSPSENLWKSTIDLAGMSTGQHIARVTGTDAEENSSFAATTFIHEHEDAPSLSILEPSQGAVVQSSIRAHATCTDGSPPCTISVFVSTSSGGWTEVGRSVGEVNIVVPATANGRRAALRFEARDNLGVLAAAERIFYVESSSRLTPVETVSGTIVDAEAERILFVQDVYSEEGSGEVGTAAVHSRTGASDDVITGVEVVANYLYLVPEGAILTSARTNAGNFRLYDWQSGSLVDLGIVFPSTAKTEGQYVIWHSSDSPSLTLRDVLAGSSSVVSTNASNGASDVGTNGVVMYQQGGQIWRYQNGTRAQLTNDAACNVRPQTDGSIVVYTKQNPCDFASSYQLTLHDGTAETALEPYGSTSFGDYLVDGGWVAYFKLVGGGSEIWTRSPTGTRSRAAALAQDQPFLEALSPNGHVVYRYANRRYVATPAGAVTEIGTRLGRPFWIGTDLYIGIGGTLMRVSY